MYVGAACAGVKLEPHATLAEVTFVIEMPRAPWAEVICCGMGEDLHWCSQRWHVAWTSERALSTPHQARKAYLARVGHERPLNTNSCADQPRNKRRAHESCIEGTLHRISSVKRPNVKRPKLLQNDELL